MSTAGAVLSSPIPPAMRFQGFYLSCALPALWDGFGKGHGGTGRAGSGRCCPRGAAGADLPCPLTFMPISISSAACPRPGMLAGLGWGAGQPFPWGLWGLCRAAGRWGCAGVDNSRTLARWQRLKGEPWDLSGKSLVGTSAVVLLVGLPSPLPTHMAKGRVGGTAEEQPFPVDCPWRK